MNEFVYKNVVGISTILCDHTLCEHASHEKYYEHSYLVSLLFADTFLLTIIFSNFFSTCFLREQLQKMLEMTFDLSIISYLHVTYHMKEY